MKTTPQPAVDAAKEINQLEGDEGVVSEDTIARLIARHYAPLVDELEQIRAWKRAATEVYSRLDSQKIARLLGVKVGESCYTVINEKVPLLVERVKELEGERDKYWNQLCDTAEALGKVSPEAAPHTVGWANQLRARVAELNSKYASAEADGNSLREEREKLIARVAELEKDRDAAVKALAPFASCAMHVTSFGNVPASSVYLWKPSDNTRELPGISAQHVLDAATIYAARAKEDAT